MPSGNFAVQLSDPSGTMKGTVDGGVLRVHRGLEDNAVVLIRQVRRGVGVAPYVQRSPSPPPQATVFWPAPGVRHLIVTLANVIHVFSRGEEAELPAAECERIKKILMDEQLVDFSKHPLYSKLRCPSNDAT